jgi:hypothetical protein
VSLERIHKHACIVEAYSAGLYYVVQRLGTGAAAEEIPLAVRRTHRESS